MVQVCPFCRKQIADEDAVCPFCGDLLVYEYPKQVASERNAVLFPVGFMLLIGAIFYGVFQSGFSGVMRGLFFLFWLAGFVVFCVYIGKGDRDFWWGR